jgi:hypothetical protein
MQMNAVQLPLLTAGYLGFGADIAIRADDVTAYYIDAPLSGSAVSRWRDGGLVKATIGSVAVFSPGTPCVLDWSGDCGQICLKVSEPQMKDGSWKPCSTALCTNELRLPGSSI